MRTRTTKPEKPNAHRHDLNFVLLANADQQTRLRLTVETFNRARQHVADVVHELGTLNKAHLQAHVYPTLRTGYALPPMMAAHVISTVINARTVETRGAENRRRSYRPGRLARARVQKAVIPANAPMPYTSHMLAFPTTDTVSLWCLERCEIVPTRLLFYEPSVRAPRGVVAELTDDTEQNVFFLHYCASTVTADALGL